MTSVVQLWTATGTTLKPVFEFGADGGTFSTANGYLSVAGLRQDLRLQRLPQPVRHPGSGRQRRLHKLAAGRQYRNSVSRRACRFASACVTPTTGPACNRTGGSMATPCCRQTTNQVAHQNNFLASGQLSVSGPGAWQHTFTGFEYNHLQANSQAVRRSRSRIFDSPFSNLSKYNRAGFGYQGHLVAAYVGANHRRLHLRRRERTHHFELRPGHRLRFLQQHHGVRFNNYLFAQELLVWKRLSGLVGVGFVNNTSFGSKFVPRVSGTFLLFRGNEAFSGTRLRAGYAEGIKEPSFQQSFGISGTFPVLPNPEPPARAEPLVGSRL